MANGAANSTAIQIQAGSRNHARRRSQPEFVFMASSRKDHFVGWIPADVDSFARVIVAVTARDLGDRVFAAFRSEEHTSELQSLRHLVCRLLLEKKKKHNNRVLRST